MTDSTVIATSIYVFGSIMFILALRGLTKIETSQRGNIFGMVGMITAIIATCFLPEFKFNAAKFLAPFIIGAALGILRAYLVDMEQMPELVAMLHAGVGLSATFVGLANFLSEKSHSNISLIETVIEVIIGAVTCTGSVIAWAKLNGKIPSSIPFYDNLGGIRHIINLCLLVTSIIIGGIFCGTAGTDYDLAWAYLCICTGLSALLGVTMVLGIGAADMPVVISFLNSYSGWACACSGFLLQNNLLVVTGALVGSSGAILSYIMCRGMNRSFLSVLAGGFGGSTAAVNDPTITGEMTEIDAANIPELLLKSKSIIIVPGYGMAMARCQHDMSDCVTALRKKKIDVKFAIHPVAGRMPGHMNVLLSEANIPHQLVKEMEDINDDFKKADYALVCGANDIVNSDASREGSPIYGMPVLKVWEAKNVIVFKRGKAGRGYAAIENPVFYNKNTSMCFADLAKSMKTIKARLEGDQGGSYQNHSVAIDVEEVKAVVVAAKIDFPPPVFAIGVPKENFPKEKRVAIAPNNVTKLRQMGFDVAIESGAGLGAGFSDEFYKKSGALIVSEEEVWKMKMIVKCRPPSVDNAKRMRKGQLFLSFIYPTSEEGKALMKAFSVDNGPSVIAMDRVPRITRAQACDALSSMATCAGYRGVIEAFSVVPRFSMNLSTAAGNIAPATVFINGAGVAGLRAISAARGLGARVLATDVRSAAFEQIESLGAEVVKPDYDWDGSAAGGYASAPPPEFVESQRKMFAKFFPEVDVVITSALAGGASAQKLISTNIVRMMKPGSVIVDLSAEMGGNTDLTVKGESIFDEISGVTIIGYNDFPSRMAPQSSELYGQNLINLIQELTKGARVNQKSKVPAQMFDLDLTSDILGQCTVVYNGLVDKVNWPEHFVPSAPIVKVVDLKREESVKSTTALLKNKQTFVEADSDDDEPHHEHHHSEDEPDSILFSIIQALFILGILIALAFATDNAFLESILVFVLSCFVGYMVVWSVTPALHTPLMAITNAISGIIVLASMLVLTPSNPYNDRYGDTASGLAIVSLLFANINIFGGFYVTQKMLSQFLKSSQKLNIN